MSEFINPELWKDPVSAEAVDAVLDEAKAVMAMQTELEEEIALEDRLMGAVKKQGNQFLAAVNAFATRRQERNGNVQLLPTADRRPSPAPGMYGFYKETGLAFSFFAFSGSDANGNRLVAEQLLVHDNPHDSHEVTRRITRANCLPVVGKDKMVPIDADALKGDELQTIYTRLHEAIAARHQRELAAEAQASAARKTGETTLRVIPFEPDDRDQ